MSGERKEQRERKEKGKRNKREGKRRTKEKNKREEQKRKERRNDAPPRSKTSKALRNVIVLVLIAERILFNNVNPREEEETASSIGTS